MAGGYATNYQLASTELLVAGAHSWVEAAPLPLAVEGLRAVSINNMVISTGEKIALSSLSYLIVTSYRRLRIHRPWELRGPGHHPQV